MLPSAATSITPSRLVSSASTSRFSAERRSDFSRAMASRILSCITVMDLSSAPVSSGPPGGMVVSSSPLAMRSATEAAARRGRTMRLRSRRVMPVASSSASKVTAMLTYLKLAILLTVWRRLTKLWSVISSVRRSNLSSMALIQPFQRGMIAAGTCLLPFVSPAARSRRSAGVRHAHWRAGRPRPDRR